MKLSIGTVRPCTLPIPNRRSIRCTVEVPQQLRLGKKWMEYQGINNWEGLLEPLDDTLRKEILRYGKFVEATYKSFDFDPSSSSYATCRYSECSLLSKSGLPSTGYRLTKNLHATSGINLPRWTERFPSWMSNQSSWIGYVAVCQDKKEIVRLGRRDIVVAYRGTGTFLEWLENIRATLTQLPNATSDVDPYGNGAMVESGFLSLYTSESATCGSLRDEVKEEISRLLELYGDEPISLTITGHSLGAALATLTAYDVATSFDHAPLVTVMSFGGPRVGNRSFKCQVEKCGTKILRIVNSSDLITKVPGFVIDDDVAEKKDDNVSGHNLSNWIQKLVMDTQWVYADVGRELQLNSRNSSPILSRLTTNVATCHDLDTYLDLVNGIMNSTCPTGTTSREKACAS